MTSFKLFSAITNVGVIIVEGAELKNKMGTLLTQGVSSVIGDGSVLQIGYYTLATPLDPFLGEWVAMTGPGTPYPTSIGDSGYPDGLTKAGALLMAGTSAFIEPAVGTPMTLRFYDSTSISTSTYFNAIATTDGSFNWVAPSDRQSSVGLSLPNTHIIWQDGSGSAFRTTIPIPEPSSFALLCILGLGGLMVRRRSGINP